MKKFQGYKCDHCGKLYQREKACEKHEDSLCGKHPNNNHPCFNCPHLSVEVVDVFHGDGPYGQEIWGKSKSFECRKKKINMYSYKFDQYNSSFETPVFDDNLPLKRMPSALDPCHEDKSWAFTDGGVFNV